MASITSGVRVYTFAHQLFPVRERRIDTETVVIVCVKLHVADSFYNIHVRLRQ